MKRARLLVAILIPVVVAAGLLYTARRLDEVAAPNPGGDLDVPVLFGRGELDYDTLAADHGGGVPILCYHYFGPGLTSGRLVRVLGAVLFNLPTLPDREYWTTTVPEFERQLDWLAAEGWRTAFLDDVIEAIDRGETPERTVVLTIDDGDRSFVEYAVPELRRRGMVATVFLLSGHVDERDWNDLDFVDWETLRALQGEGLIRVESHTHRLHTKEETPQGPAPRFLLEGARDPVRLADDLERSRRAIFRELGREPRFLAWPFGYSNARVDSVARATGFRRTFSLQPRRVGGGEAGASSFGRYAVTARTSFRVFRLMLEPFRPDSTGGAVAATW